ncbi:MAG: hypothetical protein PHV20_01600 [Bacteroidales bacterium]|nr:hypothetical protein [Bacteroidales bacterium]
MTLHKRLIILFFTLFFVLTHGEVKAQRLGSELVSLQTDRTTYIAGESIYYKLFVINSETQKYSDQSKVAYIAIRATKADPIIKIRVKLTTGMGDGRIELPDSLISGVYQLVAFTNLTRNLGEDFFFRKEITIINRFDKSLDFRVLAKELIDSTLIQFHDSLLQIHIDTTEFNQREKVSLRIGSTKPNANVTVSVFEETPFESHQTSFIDFTKLKKESLNTSKTANFACENKGKILKGKVIDTKTQESIKDAIVLLSCIDSIPNLQYIVTNHNGEFQLLLNDYYDAKELFLTIKEAAGSENWQIIVVDEFAQSQNWNSTTIANNQSQREYASKSQNLGYINKTYQPKPESASLSKKELKARIPQFYHSKVSSFYPAEFMPLPDFPEIAVEILPEVRIVKENGKYQARMLNKLMHQFELMSPAFFIDGVYVDDINKVIPLESKQIKRIDIISNQREFGDLLFGGLISITSTSNEMKRSKPASYSLRLKNDDINSGGEIVTENPKSVQNSNSPFLKQLLYWNPNLSIKSNEEQKIEFYTSDHLSNYIIKVEGIAEDGTPISSSAIIKVTDHSNATMP